MSWESFWKSTVPRGKKPRDFQTVLNLFDAWVTMR